MKFLDKLLKSSEREDFSKMNDNKKLGITLEDILKSIREKKDVCGLPREAK